MKEVIGDLLPYFAPILTAIAGFKWDWIMKKLNITQQRANVETTTLENLQKNLDLYQEIVTDLDKRYKERVKEFEENFTQSMDRLKAEIDELRLVNSELEEMVKEQRLFIQKQSKSLNYYENKFGKHSKE